jgi:hypothetical protein
MVTKKYTFQDICRATISGEKARKYSTESEVCQGEAVKFPIYGDWSLHRIVWMKSISSILSILKIPVRVTF